MPLAQTSFAQAYVQSLIESASVEQLPARCDITLRYDEQEMKRKQLNGSVVYHKMKRMLPPLLKQAGMTVNHISTVPPGWGDPGCIITVGKNDYDRALTFAEQFNANKQAIPSGPYR